MSFTQDDCEQKLEKLKLWQEKQKKILYDKQVEEKRLLCGTQQSSYDSFINNSINTNNCNYINNTTSEINQSKIVVKKPFLKKGEGLKTRFGVDPDQFNLKNIPKYKYTKKTQNICNKLSLNPQRNRIDKNKEQDRNRIDKNKEQLFQTIEKQEFCTKPTNPGSRLLPEEITNSTNQIIATPLVEGKTNSEVQTWANVLNPTHKKPISISQFKGLNILSELSQNETDQLKLYELLEQKVDSSNFSFNSTDIIELLNKSLYPNDQISKCVITNEPLLTAEEISESKLQNTLVPIPNEIDYSKSNDDSDTESCNSSFHVRFSDKVEVNRILSESDSEFDDRKNILKSLGASITSTPTQKYCTHPKSEEINVEANYEELVEHILGLKQKEFQEKSQLLDKRLKELEHEIALFQQQNQILTKMKQEHELEKIEMETRLQKSKKILDDEKIRIEIFLNDEKSKLKEEKLKFEKKHIQPNKRVREEIFHLQNQIIELKEELKTKEAKHFSAQSRVRAQTRNLEKKLHEKELEIENFKKENNKLECENGRLRRQATSKLLNEINKNITKLAIANQTPSPSSNTKQDDQNKNSSVAQTKSKVKTAKTVISSSASSTSRSSSSECDDECDLLSIDCNSSISQAKEMGKSESCNQSEISVTLKSLKREICNQDGSKDIWYPNGNIKKISGDGLSIKMLYYNKDIKETNINEGIIRYYYAETNTWHTQYLDGLEILEFPNGQTEHRHKDGKVAIHFENGSIKIKDPNDPEIAEEWRYADGTIAKFKINGEKNILLPNGQKEIHTIDHKRREYPDGTIKIVYPDGSQETRYSNGRVRLKDKEGTLIMDKCLDIFMLPNKKGPRDHDYHSISMTQYKDAHTLR